MVNQPFDNYLKAVCESSTESEKAFAHLFASGRFGQLSTQTNENTARTMFYSHLRSNTPQFEAWVREYHAHLQTQHDVRKSRTQIGKLDLDKRVANALLAAGATAASGAIGMFFGAKLMDDGTLAEVVSAGSKAALYVSPLVGITTYISGQTAKKAAAIGTAMAALGATLNAYVDNTGNTSTFAQNLSKVALIAALPAALMYYFKHR